jgi:microcystin-dependent protein
VPNYTSRFPYGATVGATGGTADAVVVSHTHTATVSDPSHTHNSGTNFLSSNIGSLAGATGTSGQYNTTIAAATTGISVSNSTTGVSGTNQNLPPYLGINFIIKT